MSNKAITKVLEADIRPPALKLTAFVMADKCDDDGGRLFPSMQQVAWWVGVSRSQAQRNVRELIALNVLTVVGNASGGAPGTTPQYRFNFDAVDLLPRIPKRGSADATGRMGATGSADATGSTHAQEGSHGCTGRVAPMHKTGSTHATQSPIYPPVTHQGSIRGAGDGAETDLFDTNPASAAAEPAARAKATGSKATKSNAVPPTAETRAAYVDAYRRRYGTDPVLAKKANAQLAQLVRTLGTDRSPVIARFFVESNEPYYVRRYHEVGLLLNDASKLNTQFAMGSGGATAGQRSASPTVASTTSKNEAAKGLLFGRDQHQHKQQSVEIIDA